ASGLMTAVAPGTTTLTIRTFNGRKASATITVVDAPTAIAFTNDPGILGAGEQTTISAKVNEGSAGGILYYSDNPEFATVNEKTGHITAIAPGTARIRAVTYVPGVEAEYFLEVRPAPTTLTMASSTIYVGYKERVQLEPIIDEGAETTFRYSSSKAKYAQVNAQGSLYCTYKGTYYITIRTHNDLSYKLKVVVRSAPGYVKVNPQTLELSAGQKFSLGATLPSGTASQLTWETLTPDILSVDENGLFTALAVGSGKAQVRTYNGKTAVCTVNVVAAPSAVYPPETALSVAENLQTEAVFTVNEGSYADFTYASADDAIATVDENGIVTGVTRGETEIIATTHNGLSTSVKVTVLPAPDEIIFEQESLTLGLGEVYQLTHSALPEDAVGVYSYASSDSRIVNVSAEGLLSCRALGTVEITVTAQNGTAAVMPVTVENYGNVHEALCAAHRGASGYRRDNTLAAIRYAAELNADEVELDVRMTKDGHLVLFHNDTLSYAGKAYSISALTLSQILSVQPHICLLKDALNYIASTNMNAQLEFKVSGIESAVIECVESCGMASRVKYESFNYDILKKVRALRPDAYTVYLISSSTTAKNVTSNLSKYDVDAISLSHSIATAEMVFKIHQAGMEAVVWTVNTRELIDKYRAMGVDVIITNYPNYMTGASVPPAPTSVSFDQSAYTVYLEDTLQLQPRINAGSATDFCYSAASSAYFTVDANGLITPLRHGTSTVTVSTYNGLTATATINVVDRYFPTAIAITSTPSQYMEIGMTYTPTVTVEPETAIADIKWTSSAPDIASVDPVTGTVTAVSYGKAVITGVSQRNPALTVKYNFVVLSDTRCLKVPSQKSDISGINNTLSQIRNVRASAFLELESLYQKGIITQSDYNARKGYITRAFDMYMVPWVTDETMFYW
ncbi:MAG: Ig-like domain-containing protein, partial [Clostridia bacterium]|nr:Ig-like domain-containing protein [Clostridia bacterium]